jgi:hypothetical protein
VGVSSYPTKADVPQRSEAYLLDVARSSIMDNAKSARAKKGLVRTVVVGYHRWWTCNNIRHT